MQGNQRKIGAQLALGIVVVGLAGLPCSAGGGNSQPVTSLWADCGRLPVSDGGIAGSAFNEDFETFALGAGCQQGWTGNAACANFTIVDDATPSFETRSARHVSNGAGTPGMGSVQIRSPAVAPEPRLVEFDVYIAGADVTNYGMETASCVAAGCLINTRVFFDAGGTISALQANAGCTGVFAATTGTWAPDEVMRLGIEVIDDGTLNVYKNGALIFTGRDIATDCTANPTGIANLGVFASNVGTASSLVLDNISSPVVCAADVNGDGVVDVNDLLDMIGAWGSADPDADLTDDGVVDVNDLLALIAGWGCGL